ncbi:cupin domain-containing protein [Paenarthrobacter sp. RAF54_2]|uniref:cupin domain-containing protein n=1 Tax=Paenarthrobacter sp. RAF54_2 TaxID=3233061 RepID=UPI003F9D4AA1
MTVMDFVSDPGGSLAGQPEHGQGDFRLALCLGSVLVVVTDPAEHLTTNCLCCANHIVSLPVNYFNRDVKDPFDFRLPWRLHRNSHNLFAEPMWSSREWLDDLMDTGGMLPSRIRELRRDRGMTLNQVSQRSGLSVAMLSQVERGLSDPSLESLRRLAETLDVPLFDLFRTEDAEQVAVIRKDQRRLVSSPQGQIVYSQASRSGGKLEVLEAVLEPGAASSSKPRTHASEECVLVLEGRLVVEVSGTNHELNAGDSCYFSSTLPHRFVNPSENQTRILVSVTPPSN